MIFVCPYDALTGIDNHLRAPLKTAMVNWVPSLNNNIITIITIIMMVMMMIIIITVNYYYYYRLTQLLNKKL